MALHVDYEVRWKNFKGFKDTNWIKIKPITIILGTNNSGKSSFLSPLLLMNQTLNSRDPYLPILTKGPLIDNGSIKEIFKDYNVHKEVFFGFRYHVHDPDPNEKLEEIGTYPPGAFEVTLGSKNEGKELVVKSQTIYDIYKRMYVQLKMGEDGKYELKGLNKSKLQKIEKESIANSKPINFLFSPNNFINNIRNMDMKNEKDLDKKISKKQFSEEFSELLRSVSANYSESIDILGNLSFIGPIRQNPRRVYEVTGESQDTVGSRGENIGNLLNENFNNIESELNEWISKFGFGDRIIFRNLYENFYSLEFQEGERFSTIANVGFGASQILPLIVQALISSDGALTIAEQPEIHLNPRLQGVLADLFAYMAKRDQRLVVETHSEHLLLRLR